jgi:Transposase DDE domain group 1
MSYKNVKGYHPNLAFIGSLPVHIENHNGNTPARYQQTQTLTRCFDSLEKEGVSIAHFRADSASYQKEVIDLVNEKAGCFYIRISDCANLRTQCAGIKHWETIEVGYIQKEVASILYAPFGEDKTYRVVVTRVKKKTKQIDIESATGYDYYGIITNNDWLSNKNLILFYNQRGDAENSNRYLLNDFNLHHLPFSDMNTNTVYMYLESPQ